MPCSADITTGSPSPKQKDSYTPALAARPSTLLATRITEFALRLIFSAYNSSAAVIPALASITNKHASALLIASRDNELILCCKDSSDASSSPAVSIILNFIFLKLTSPSLKSRVTPG